MVIAGGDSLEENFILDGDDSESNCSDSGSEASIPVSAQRESPNDDEEIDQTVDVETPQAKKQKLNWREGATKSLGSPDSQALLIKSATSAFCAYFPKDPSVSADSDISSLRFLDCEEFAKRDEKSVRDMLEFFRGRGFFFTPDETRKGLNTIVISASATRAMYIVKEIREFDSKLAPLPLFFHGGGRKKEQGATHDAVLRGSKTSVAVCLPSRLKAAMENGLINFTGIDLVVFDLKPNEKRLNVLSQKESLKDVLSIVLDHLVPNSHEKLRIALL